MSTDRLWRPEQLVKGWPEVVAVNACELHSDGPLRLESAYARTGRESVRKRTRTITEVGMTRTDVVASSRPRGAAGQGGDAARSRIARAASALPLALIVSAGLAMPTSALAASEGLSGYTTTPTTTTTTTPPPSTTPTTPTTTPTTPTTTPTTGTSPSKEEATPTTSSSGVSPSSETATTGTTPSKASTLPFTGFDLRWSLVVGLALIAAGFSLMVLQRRHHRDSGR